MPLPAYDYPACTTRVVKPNPYIQVTFETNRYSVPAEYRDKQLVLRAFPFRIEILYLDEVIATHPRCFGKEQDVLDPLHYLPLLEQRPGAFEHALPLRRWRKKWPPSYERLLQELRESRPNGGGIGEFSGRSEAASRTCALHWSSERFKLRSTWERPIWTASNCVYGNCSIHSLCPGRLT